MYLVRYDTMGEKPRHWISVPHEGPREVEFELEWVEFSDGVTRGICTSDAVPVDYWPRAVYVANLASGTYEVLERGTFVPPQTPSARRVLIFL